MIFWKNKRKKALKVPLTNVISIIFPPVLLSEWNGLPQYPVCVYLWGTLILKTVPYIEYCTYCRSAVVYYTADTTSNTVGIQFEIPNISIDYNLASCTLIIKTSRPLHIAIESYTNIPYIGFVRSPIYILGIFRD